MVAGIFFGVLNDEKKDAALPKTNGLPLKNGGKGRLSPFLLGHSFWGKRPIFRDRCSREGICGDGSFGVSSNQIPIILGTIH